MRRTPSAATSAQRELARPADEQIDGLGRDRRDNGGDVLARADARRVETIGTGVGICLEPRDRFGEIGTADEKAFRTPDEQRVSARLVDRAPRRAHPLDRDGKIVERPRCVAGRVLDRQSRDARFDGETHALRDTGRV